MTDWLPWTHGSDWKVVRVLYVDINAFHRNVFTKLFSPSRRHSSIFISVVASVQDRKLQRQITDELGFLLTFLVFLLTKKQDSCRSKTCRFPAFLNHKTMIYEMYCRYSIAVSTLYVINRAFDNDHDQKTCRRARFPQMAPTKYCYHYGNDHKNDSLYIRAIISRLMVYCTYLPVCFTVIMITYSTANLSQSSSIILCMKVLT